ncbi:MAG: SsrA-binding protein SmpB [Candidatus Caldatribacteriota bacterium]
MKSNSSEEVKNIAVNRKVYHDFTILNTYEAGIALKGTEVKSVREGKVSLRESFAQFEDSELYLVNMHISPYLYGNIFNVEPKRKRKLLLHKLEIKRLKGQVQEKGLTLVPVRIYFKKGLVKIELALARGKRLFDKRKALAEKDAQREMEREIKDKKWGR